MNKSDLLKIIQDQRQVFSIKPGLIPRSKKQKIKDALKTGQIVIVSGVRRCGKSTLLQEIREEETDRDYFLNFDDERLIHFEVKDFQVLWEIFLEEYGEQDVFYFDEIQNINGWERFIRRLHDYGKKVIITGSNASMLSRELGTHLTGRHILITLYPLSFKEIVTAKGIDPTQVKTPSTLLKSKLVRLFKEYMKTGGFPEFISTKNPDILKSLYESIVYRDILARYHLTSEEPMKSLLHFAAGHIGKEISFSKLKALINVGSPTTVKDYFFYIESTYLAFLIRQFHTSLRRQILAQKKVYFIDVELANTIGFRFSENIGQTLENIVFLELKRRDKDIYYHRATKECDFLVREGLHITQAIQVTHELSSAKTKEREMAGLCEAMEMYGLKKGLILTSDFEAVEKVRLKNGKSAQIDICPIWKWMLL